MQDIINLYRNFDKYNNLSDDELKLYLQPSIKLKQYKIHYDNNETIGFTNWAYLSDRSQKTFIKEGFINPEEWKSGNNLWHIETICKRNLHKIIKWTKKYFSDHYGVGKAINWLRVDNDTFIRNVVKIHTKESWS